MSESERVGDSDPLTWIILVGFLVVVGVAVFAFPLTTGRSPRSCRQNACINNLRQIDGAKDQWASENKIVAGANPLTNIVVSYLRSNRMPVCPEGGVYSLNPIGTNPTCNIPLHVLP